MSVPLSIPIQLVASLVYTGNYSKEIGVFIPFVYYLKSNNLLCNTKVISYTGMRAYYFFLNDNEYQERNENREAAKYDWFLPDTLKDFQYQIKPEYFTPPNFYEQYKDKLGGIAKPIIVIQNKYKTFYNNNAQQLPTNYFDLEELQYMFEALQDKFQIIYIRSDEYFKTILSNKTIHISYDLGDKEMIQEMYSKIITLESFLKNNPRLDINIAKCIIEAAASATISTIGGFNVFDAYFPSKHIIFSKDPSDTDANLYQNQHNLLCPSNASKIQFATSFEQLKEFINSL